MCRAPATRVQPWLSIVGIGLDGWAGLAAGAREAVEAATLVVGGDRHLAMLPVIAGQHRMPWPSPLYQGIDAIIARRGEPVCVLASGDPFWFGVGATLARAVDGDEMRVWPQPSAFSLAAARMGWALQHVVCLSVHGRALARVVPTLHDSARLLILSWDGTTPAALAALLVERGFSASRLTVLEQMGGTGENRISATAMDWPMAETEALNTIAVDCVADAVARPIPAAAGRSDSLFASDGQLTKREVRAVVMALLAPGRGERLWDIGAGSGAVGIEWMLADPRNSAVAVEARPDRAERLRANAAEFGVPDLACVVGHAPDALADLAPPDAIFIGGGLTMPGLLLTCRDALAGRPRARIVATSVTVEGDRVLTETQAGHGGSLRRIDVSRAEPLGDLYGWNPLRPITLWCSRNDT